MVPPPGTRPALGGGGVFGGLPHGAPPLAAPQLSCGAGGPFASTRPLLRAFDPPNGSWGARAYKKKERHRVGYTATEPDALVQGAGRRARWVEGASTDQGAARGRNGARQGDARQAAAVCALGSSGKDGNKPSQKKAPGT